MKLVLEGMDLIIIVYHHQVNIYQIRYNTYNQLDREQYHNRYNYINRNSQNVQDKIRKTMKKDEPNMDLIRAINQEIHNTTHK